MTNNKHEQFSFFYDGDVRGQGRPRYTRRGIAYNSKKDKEYRKAVQDAFLSKNFGSKPFEGPVSVEIHVYRNLPKSSKETRQHDVFKPDIDNISKAVLDALNGLAFVDDRQVVDLRIVKHDRTSSDSFMSVCIRRIDECIY